MLGIVEDSTHGGGDACDVARRKGDAGAPVDHGFTQPADIGGHQRNPRRGRLEAHDAEWLVVAGQHGGVSSVQ